MSAVASPPKSIKFYKTGRLTEKKKPEVKAWLYVKHTDNKFCWSFTFFDDDTQSENIAVTGTYENMKSAEAHYLALLEGLNWLKSMGERKFLIYTDNIYLYNIIKEWLQKWEKTKFIIDETTNRPYIELLIKIYEMKGTVPFEMVHYFKDPQFTQENSNWNQTIKLTEEEGKSL